MVRIVRRAFTLIELMAVVIIIGALVGIAVPQFQDMLTRAKVARAIGDIQAIQTDIDSRDSLPETLADVARSGYLDPWGTPYVYFKFPVGGKGPPPGARRDRFLVPVNSEYDLYSMGVDKKSAIAFTAKASHDDIVRANDGGYIGLAVKY